jgi:hypothetical protein
MVGWAVLSLLGLTASPPPAGRGLTGGERALLAPIFRQAVDYDRVRIIQGKAFPLQGATTYVTIGDAVFAPGTLYRADFSRSDGGRQAILVHEVAHVWQHQNGIPVVAGAVRAFFAHRGRYHRAYAYTLASGGDLLDFGIEQQASILADFFLARDRARFHRVLRRFLSDPRYPLSRRRR